MKARLAAAAGASTSLICGVSLRGCATRGPGRMVGSVAEPCARNAGAATRPVAVCRSTSKSPKSARDCIVRLDD